MTKNPLFHVLIQAAHDLCEGKSVLLTSGDDRTTPRAAAEAFGMGHECLSDLIDRGELAHRPSGLLRLVSLKDVHDIHVRRLERRREQMEGLRDALGEAGQEG